MLLFSGTTFWLPNRHPQPQQPKVGMEAGGPGGKYSSRRDQIAAILQSCPPLLQSYPGMETDENLEFYKVLRPDDNAME